MAETEHGANAPWGGQRVKAGSAAQPWGLSIEIIGHEGVGASIDYLDIVAPNRGPGFSIS